MQISSKSFADNGAIPARFTCDGEDLNPELRITGIPRETKTLALIMDDPDSPTGTWVHWVHFNLPTMGKTGLISEGTSPLGVSGQNTWGKLGYGGPCPGNGIHRYIFKIYALDNELPLSEGATKDDLLRAMQGHILDETELIGRYERFA